MAAAGMKTLLFRRTGMRYHVRAPPHGCATMRLRYGLCCLNRAPPAVYTPERFVGTLLSRNCRRGLVPWPPTARGCGPEAAAPRVEAAAASCGMIEAAEAAEAVAEAVAEGDGAAAVVERGAL